MAAGMRLDRGARKQLLGLALVVCGLGIWLPAQGTAAGTRGCRSFESQASAQAFFMESGGSPTRAVGKLDPDHDGVACETLKPPYQGYATLDYNKRHRFLYGVVTMPRGNAGKGEFPCLVGSSHFPDAPRRLNVLRVRSGKKDRAVLPQRGRGTEAKPATGRLLWKADKKVLPAARYFVEFEAVVKIKPYGKNPCPAFRSRAVALP